MEEPTIAKLRELIARVRAMEERLGKPVNLLRDRASAFVTESGDVVTIVPVKRHRKTRLMVIGAKEIHHERIEKSA